MKSTGVICWNIQLHVYILCFCLCVDYFMQTKWIFVLNESFWYGMVWYGMVWYGMVWYGMVWYGALWYDMVRYGWLRCGVVW